MTIFFAGINKQVVASATELNFYAHPFNREKEKLKDQRELKKPWNISNQLIILE